MAELIVAHLAGDFLFQTDWMAQNKTSDSFVCFVHCVVYTFAVVLAGIVSGIGWPVWAYGVVFATHFPIDRWRLANVWMEYMDQRGFRDNLAPWSTFVVDGTMHLIVILTIQCVVGT